MRQRESAASKRDSSGGGGLLLLVPPAAAAAGGCGDLVGGGIDAVVVVRARPGGQRFLSHGTKPTSGWSTRFRLVTRVRACCLHLFFFVLFSSLLLWCKS